MIKNLAVFGCGWTYGNELPDQSTQSYPVLIADHFNWPLEVQTDTNATLSMLLLAVTSWLTSHSADEIANTLIIVGLTDENRGNPDNSGYWPESNYNFTVSALDEIAKQYGANLLQFNVLTKNYKIKAPTLIDSSSALEMLVIRDKPRKAPLFTEHKHPNEKGHTIISEFLINKIDSVILHE